MPADYNSEAEDNPREVFDETTFQRPAAILAHTTQAAGNGAHGVWTATTFSPPSNLATSSPDSIFAPRLFNATIGPTCRFVLRRRHVPALGTLKTMAIFTNGACADNGGSNGRTPHGGCAFIFRPDIPGGTVSFALEQRGPDDVEHAHTSNRAELRAAVAALAFRYWCGEGWRRIVLVTDSEYVGVHAVGWLRTWEERGWVTSSGRPVKNRDLWEKLSERIGELARRGCEVSIWTVPRRWNGEADAAGKAAVEKEGLVDFTDRNGVLC